MKNLSESYSVTSGPELLSESSDATTQLGRIELLEFALQPAGSAWLRLTGLERLLLGGARPVIALGNPAAVPLFTVHLHDLEIQGMSQDSRLTADYVVLSGTACLPEVEKLVPVTAC